MMFSGTKNLQSLNVDLDNVVIDNACFLDVIVDDKFNWRKYITTLKNSK